MMIARWRGLIRSIGLDILKWDWQRGGVGDDVQSMLLVDASSLFFL
jgi:hypothetical protein